MYSLYWRFKRSSCKVVIYGVEIDTAQCLRYDLFEIRVVRPQRNSSISTRKDFFYSLYSLITQYN